MTTRGQTRGPRQHGERPRCRGTKKKPSRREPIKRYHTFRGTLTRIKKADQEAFDAEFADNLARMRVRMEELKESDPVVATEEEMLRERMERAREKRWVK